MKFLLSRTLALVATVCVLGGVASAQTTTKTFSTTELNEMDHHQLYTWRINTSSVDLAGGYISAVSLTFKDMRNWDANDNRLFAHLFDTARFSGVNGFYDDDPDNATVSDIRDDFTSGRFPQSNGRDASGARADWLLNPNTADTFLFDQRFDYYANAASAPNFVYSFSDEQIASLTAYMLNDDRIALGFDSDCHYYNSGIDLKITVTPGVNPNLRVPEPATGALLLVGAGFLALRRRRNK